MSHTPQPNRSAKARVVPGQSGRSSARVEAAIAANSDVLAVTHDLASEIGQLLVDEGRELRLCQKLEHDLCASTCRTRAIHDRIEELRVDRRRQNAALCRGEALA